MSATVNQPRDKLQLLYHPVAKVEKAWMDEWGIDSALVRHEHCSCPAGDVRAAKAASALARDTWTSLMCHKWIK